MILHDRRSPPLFASGGRPDPQPATACDRRRSDGARSPQDMADSYASDSDDDSGQSDSLTLPALWQPAACAQRPSLTDGDSRVGDISLPPPWLPAAAAVRRSGSPPWGRCHARQRNDEALLAAAVAGTALEDSGRLGGRAASTGALTALLSTSGALSGDVSQPSRGAAPPPKGRDWLGAFVARSDSKFLGGYIKTGSSPALGDVHTRIRAHRPIAAGADPAYCQDPAQLVLWYARERPSGVAEHDIRLIYPHRPQLGACTKHVRARDICVNNTVVAEPRPFVLPFAQVIKRRRSVVLSAVKPAKPTRCAPCLGIGFWSDLSRGRHGRRGQTTGFDLAPQGDITLHLRARVSGSPNRGS